MRVAWIVLVLSTGCRSLLGFEDPVTIDGDAALGDGNSTDGSPDGLFDADVGDAGDACFGGFTLVCPLVLPSMPLDINTNLTINTDSDPRCGPTTNAAAANVCVVMATSISISGTLRGVGSRPLLLLATTGTIVVIGLVDVASHGGDGTRAAGNQPSTCANATPPSGQGGGAGGSFGGRGGNGGGVGGIAAASVQLIDLHGGCRGTNGGGAGNGLAGQSGGAVELNASSITINGTLNASGAGGQGGSANSAGAGGGGSGGAIVFSTPNLTINGGGRVVANGGGGGEGAGNNVPGSTGGDPSAINVNTPAIGGSGNTSGGGDGGNGGSGNSGANGMPGSNGGGGGGGGGTGFVKSLDPAPVLAGQVSPAIN